MRPVLLLIDDDPLDVATRAELLVLGYRVVQTASGTEGAALSRLERPQAILVSLDMPGVSGVTAVLRLKLDPQTRAIPVVALTASRGEHPERALQLGCVATIAKPLGGGMLAALVDWLATMRLAS